MVYIGSGTKITDGTFLQIKSVLQQAQKGLDAEDEAFRKSTEHENPSPSLNGPREVSRNIIVNDEPRKRLQYNTTRIRKEALQRVLEIASEHLKAYK